MECAGLDLKVDFLGDKRLNCDRRLIIEERINAGTG